MTPESSPADSAAADQRPSSKMTWFLIAIAVLAVGAVVAFRATLSLSTPAAARETAQKFVDAICHADLKTAQSLCDASVDRVAMDRSLPTLQGWGNPKAISSLIGMKQKSMDTAVERFDFSADVEYETVRHVLTVTVNGADRSWKVSSYAFQ